MADGATFEITVEAQAIGADATADQVNHLAAGLEAAERVATPFDAALAAAQSQLANAASAAASAASELQVAEQRFTGLERASARAGKAMERAANKGNIAGYQAARQAAAEAAAAVRQQAAAVDRARAAASAAAGAEQKLAASMKVLEGRARRASATIKAKAKASTNLASADLRASDAAGVLGGRMGEMISRGENAVNVFRALGPAIPVVVVLAAAAAFIGLGVALAGAAVRGLRYAIAQDKIAKARLDKITKRTADAFKALFEDINTKPLIDAWDSFTSQLTQSTAAGHALKTLLRTVLDPFAAAIKKVEPLAREMFKGAVYGALQLAIVAYRVRNAILRVIPDEVKAKIKALIGDEEALSAAFSAGEAVVYAAATAIGLLGVGFIMVAAAIALTYAQISGIVEGFAWLVGQVPAVGAALDGLAQAVADAINSSLDALAGWAKDALKAAKNFVNGLVKGIASGEGAVGAAAAALGGAALAGLAGALQSHSPSRVMMRQGGYAAEGVAMGIKKGTPKVRSAVEQMASAVIGDGPQGGAKGDSSVQTTTTTSSRGTYHVTINAPSGDGDDILGAFESWFEAQGISMGVGPEPEAA